MSRSYHVTENKRRQDNWLNRNDDNELPEGLSELDELALKKLAAKETEKWRRDAQKAGTISHYVFRHKPEGWDNYLQKCRGKLSEIPNMEERESEQAAAPNALQSQAPSEH